nr:MAG TPA: hypothetical protein [Ackermannviridae sp.]
MLMLPLSLFVPKIHSLNIRCFATLTTNTSPNGLWKVTYNRIY